MLLANQLLKKNVINFPINSLLKKKNFQAKILDILIKKIFSIKFSIKRLLNEILNQKKKTTNKIIKKNSRYLKKKFLTKIFTFSLLKKNF